MRKPDRRSFATLPFDSLTLRVFTTTEGPRDITYIFETKDSLVLFGCPPSITCPGN